MTEALLTLKQIKEFKTIKELKEKINKINIFNNQEKAKQNLSNILFKEKIEIDHTNLINNLYKK